MSKVSEGGTILIANTREMSPRLGGVERISCNLAKELVRRGYRIVFFAGFAVEEEQTYADGIEKYFLPDQERFDSFLNVNYLKTLIKDEKVEVIINQAGNIETFNHLCVEAVRYIGNVRLVSAIHIQPNYLFLQLGDLRVSQMEKTSYVKAIRRAFLYPYRKHKLIKSEREKYHYILESSDQIVVLSESYRKLLCEVAGDTSYIMLSKIITIGNFVPVRLEFQDVQKEKSVLWIGRMDFIHKRPDRIILIWEKIRKGHPEWRLDIAGEGDYLERLKAYVIKKRIENVYFHGNCDPTQLYKKASILCMTSTIEGLPMVLLEGMAEGCIPVVYGSFSAAEDIIIDGENGYIVTPFHEKEYIEVMNGLMANEKGRKQLMAKIVSLPSVEEIMDKWDKLLSD